MTIRRRPWLPLLFAAALAGCDAAPPPDAHPSISPEDRELGAEQHPALLAEFGGAYAGPEAGYVARIGAKMAGAAGLGDQCTFTLVNSDVVNAFAVPGCYIYVTRGLLAVVTSEAELASVIGHEIGHIVGQHAQRQQRRSFWRAIGVLAAGLTGSEFLTRIASEAAQFFTLRYSRTQEYESDDLGIAYLRTAGYDPYAAADMLGALARQEAYMTATAGRDEARAIPEWALSHPLTENRVRRARDDARKTGLADDALPENVAPYLREVDGLLYGDDPEQGFVVGRRFAHPLMRIAFEAPPGFTLANSPQAIGLSGPNGVRGEFGGGAIPPGGLPAYVEQLAGRLLGDSAAAVGQPRARTINGLPALIVPARITTQAGTALLTIAAYDAGNGQAYHFIMVTPPDNDGGAIEPLIESFHLLSQSEAAALRPRFIRVVAVGPGETQASLARRMASDQGLALLRVLNGLGDAEALKPGRRLKIVALER